MAIVVSLISSDFDSLARSAVRQAKLADLVELRLDRIGHPGEALLKELVRECSKPVIVTVHGPEAFGRFQGSVDERCEILLAASRAGAMFVDIDYRLSLELGEVEGKCHRIVSRHELDGTPMDLETFEEDVREVLYEGDVVKLVPHARTTEDGLRVLRHLRKAPGGLVAFCSGPAGSFTRLLAPILGSPFTYAAPAELPGDPLREPTAPGQLRVNELLGMVPPGGLSQETAIFGVVGRPIGHSASPWVQGMALKNAHLDAVYVAYEPHDFERFLELYDDENYRGLSVTAPFKEAAFRAASMRDEASVKSGAVNTLVRDRGGWRGSNTDVPAISETLERAFRVHGSQPGRPVALGAAHALVLGTGGAARAAALAMHDSAARVTIAGRSLEKARELAQATGLNVQAVAWDDIPGVEYDLLIHCTPVGTGDDGQLPVPEDWIRPNSLVLDAVYRPIRTPLLLAARRRGATAVPGGEWFVRQAAAQFQLFTHKEPDESLMRHAFENALGHAPADVGGEAPA